MRFIYILEMCAKIKNVTGLKGQTAGRFMYSYADLMSDLEIAADMANVADMSKDSVSQTNNQQTEGLICH